MCSQTDNPIEPGAAFYSGLIEDGDLFQRRDYCSAAWPGVDKAGFFSYWKNKGRASRDDNKPKAIDYDRLLSFFDDLAGAEEAHRRLFRYVIALMLSRRRILRLDTVKKTPDGDRLVLYDRRVPGEIEVFAPEVGAEQMRQVQERLNELFDLDDEEGEG